MFFTGTLSFTGSKKHCPRDPSRTPSMKAPCAMRRHNFSSIILKITPFFWGRQATQNIGQEDELLFINGFGPSILTTFLNLFNLAAKTETNYCLLFDLKHVPKRMQQKPLKTRF